MAVSKWWRVPPVGGPGRRQQRRLRLLLLLSGLVPAGACEEPLMAPPPPGGYLAVVIQAEGPVSPGKQYSLRIREISGTMGIDHRIPVLPNDTVVLPYPVATYDIYVDSVPPACTSRIGFAQRALISSPGNTSIARFRFDCASLLTLVAVTDGYQLDDRYVWRLTEPDGRVRSGMIGPVDTLRLDSIRPGTHRVELSHLAPNCAVLLDGARSHPVEVQPPHPQTVVYRVRCSDPVRAPRVLRFESSVVDGVSGFYAEIYDPDRDLDRYDWTITDCAGNPLVPGVRLFRHMIRSWRPAQDTVRLVASVHRAVEVPAAARRCTAVLFSDQLGNTSAWVEEPEGREQGTPPIITSFHASYRSGVIQSRVSVSDPDGDIAGFFLSVSFLDGTLYTPDGRPDVGVASPVGYPSAELLPEIDLVRLGVSPDRVLSVNLDVIDRGGNLSRAIDRNLDS